MSQKIINANPQVVAALGKPISPGAFVTGEISSGGSSSSADFSLPIYGSKGSGQLDVNGDWSRGVWDLDLWVVYEADGEEQTIHIAQKVK
jgi:hypothetical protein